MAGASARRRDFPAGSRSASPTIPSAGPLNSCSHRRRPDTGHGPASLRFWKSSRRAPPSRNWPYPARERLRTAVRKRAGLDHQPVVTRLRPLGSDAPGCENRLAEQILGRKDRDVSHVDRPRHGPDQPVARTDRIRGPLRRHRQNTQYAPRPLHPRPAAQRVAEQRRRSGIARVLAEVAQKPLEEQRFRLTSSAAGLRQRALGVLNRAILILRIHVHSHYSFSTQGEDSKPGAGAAAGTGCWSALRARAGSVRTMRRPLWASHLDIP
jgi:hypothetical protein